MRIKYNLKKSGNGVVINVETDNQPKLLQAFQECKDGKCTCPTDEYKKLKSLSINEGEGEITLQLVAKENETISLSEIEKCLEHTKKQN